jgi:hypothetical protein
VLAAGFSTSREHAASSRTEAKNAGETRMVILAAASFG